jgi:lysine decarboxylase/arginine decarboxylase
METPNNIENAISFRQKSHIQPGQVTAAMMDGPSGHALTSESIQEAVAFRQTVARIHAELSKKGEWFFQTWQPDRVRDGRRTLPVYEVPADQLASDPSCWVLRPNETWHGFGAIEDGYAMLDPIKVSVLTPGVATRGGLERIGLPAALLTAYLGQQGVVAEKTTDFSVLFLFSLGITKGKWGTLINALLDCKRDLDANAPLERVLPALVAANPARYREMGFGDLAREMFGAMKELRTTEYLAAGFSTLPVPELSPVEAYEWLVLNEVERVPVEQMSGRVVATGVVPYRPGIPLLMPGENAGPARGPILGYLDSLLRFDARFPGFAHDTHGMEVEGGVGRVYCARRGKRR